jgi:hypothetical protein
MGFLAPVVGSVITGAMGALSKKKGKEPATISQAEGTQTSTPPLGAMGGMGESLIDKFQNSNFLNTLVNAGGQALSKKMFGKSPGKLGQEHKKYMDSAFPGTTPWEQLGSGAASGGMMGTESQTGTQRSTVSQQISSAEKQKKWDLENAKEIKQIERDTALQLQENEQQFRSETDLRPDILNANKVKTASEAALNWAKINNVDVLTEKELRQVDLLDQTLPEQAKIVIANAIQEEYKARTGIAEYNAKQAGNWFNTFWEHNATNEELKNFGTKVLIDIFETDIDWDKLEKGEFGAFLATMGAAASKAFAARTKTFKKTSIGSPKGIKHKQKPNTPSKNPIPNNVRKTIQKSPKKQLLDDHKKMKTKPKKQEKLPFDDWTKQKEKESWERVYEKQYGPAFKKYRKYKD